MATEERETMTLIGSDNDWSWEDRTRTRGVDDYYGVIPT